jgi:amidase
MQDAIDVLKRQGAEIIDPANIPSMVDPDLQRNLDRWGICSGVGNSKGGDSNCSIVLKYGMKRDFNRWLSTLGPTAPVKSLTELRNGTSNTSEPARSAMDNRISTSPMRSTWTPTAHATKRIARKTSRWLRHTASMK